MIPPLIVQEALNKGIEIIAITDHNATANIEAVQKAAFGTVLHVLPGVELQTVEEVHVLCLFDELDQVQSLQGLINSSLPDQQNNVDFFGEQFIVDETGDFVRREERLLLTSTSISINSAWSIVNALGGLLIPAHVNRKAFGLFQVLGFIPTDIDLEILEITTHISPDIARERYPSLKDRALIMNGDAHFLEDIKGPNLFTIEAPRINEIRLALLNQNPHNHQFI